jgi:hypothetical protein
MFKSIHNKCNSTKSLIITADVFCVMHSYYKPFGGWGEPVCIMYIKLKKKITVTGA